MGETDSGGEKKYTFKNSALQTGIDWFEIGKLKEVEKYHIKIKKENFQKDFFTVSTFKKMFWMPWENLLKHKRRETKQKLKVIHISS